MYCINCGVQLADSESSCPLCGTAVHHPDFPKSDVRPQYPSGRKPHVQPSSKAFNGMLILIFLFATVFCFVSDLFSDGRLEWFGFAAGGLLLAYIILALPLWFRSPSPAVFVPCSFAACALYLLYIDLVTGGGWFLIFAFPVTGALCLIFTAFTVLLRYLKRGKLYVWGGMFIALGGFMLLLEFLLGLSFGLGFTGWSLYPLFALALLGGLLLYLAISSSAREMLARKLFF